MEGSIPRARRAPSSTIYGGLHNIKLHPAPYKEGSKISNSIGLPFQEREA